jgi:hypothetical protein
MPSSVYRDMINRLCFVFPSGEVEVCLWILRCENIAILTIKSSDEAKFTTPKSLSLSVFIHTLVPSCFCVYFFIEITEKKFSVANMEFMKYKLQFLTQIVLFITTFILSCDVRVQKNSIPPTRSYLLQTLYFVAFRIFPFNVFRTKWWISLHVIWRSCHYELPLLRIFFNFLAS